MNRRAFWVPLLRFLSSAMLGIALLSLFSCATVSSGPSSAASATDRALLLNPFAKLPSGASLYVYGDIEKTRNLINGLYRLGPVKALQRIPEKSLAKVGTVYGALYNEEEPQRFYILVSGRFPVVRTFLSLTFSPDWKQKRTEGFSYWRSEKDGLSLHIDSKQMVITDGIPLKGSSEERPLKSGSLQNNVNGEAGGEPADLIAGTNFFLMFNKPRTIIQSFISGLGPLGESFNIPVEKVIFRVYPSAKPGIYEVQANLVTSSPTYGKALGALISLVTRFMPPVSDSMDSSQPEQVIQRMAVLLLSERPVVEGPLVNLSSKPITEAELTLLLHSLLVYSEQNKLF
ncbi:hypothetical protein [Gracilinema caldarium]|nr:hypothetical protein [Gracilinema caldarium]